MNTEKRKHDPYDSWSVHELVERALATRDDEEYTTIVLHLHDRGDREVFDAARVLTSSVDSTAKVLGADILSHIGMPDRTFPEESRDILLLLLQDQDPKVVAAAVNAVGNHCSLKAIEPLCNLKNHPASDVRKAVAYALSGVREDPAALSALLQLTTDKDREVREEASRGLVFADRSNDKVTETLRKMVADIDPEVRGNALLGLAIRQYLGVVDLIIQELSKEEFWDDTIDAAAETCDPRLLPVLLKLKDDEVESLYLDTAIKNCSSGTPRSRFWGR